MLTNELRDPLDTISLIVSVPLGIVIVAIIRHLVDAALLVERGHSAFGGEFILYSLLFGGLVFATFQILQIVLHHIFEVVDPEQRSTFSGVVQLVSAQDFDSCNAGSIPATAVQCSK